MDFYLQGIFLSKTKQTQLWDFELSLQALLYTYFTYLSAKKKRCVMLLFIFIFTLIVPIPNKAQKFR